MKAKNAAVILLVFFAAAGLSGIGGNGVRPYNVPPISTKAPKAGYPGRHAGKLGKIWNSGEICPVLTASAAQALGGLAEKEPEPEKPYELSAAGIKERQVSLRWKETHANMRYRVYLEGSVVAQGTGGAITIGNLQPDTKYIFTVTAVDSLGNESPHSDPLMIKTSSVGSGGGIRSFLLHALSVFAALVIVSASAFALIYRYRSKS